MFCKRVIFVCLSFFDRGIRESALGTRCNQAGSAMRVRKTEDRASRVGVLRASRPQKYTTCTCLLHMMPVCHVLHFMYT